jgi:hypothetical protein
MAQHLIAQAMAVKHHFLKMARISLATFYDTSAGKGAGRCLAKSAGLVYNIHAHASGRTFRS